MNHQYKLSKDGMTKITPWSNYTNNNRKLSALRESSSFKSDTHKSCAIVGNSGRLLSTNYGELIDSHDYVIRFNQATTEGYEDHVGSKTNARVVNCHVINSLMPLESNQHNIETFSKFDPQFLLKIQNETVFFKDIPNATLNSLAKLRQIMHDNGCESSFLDQQWMTDLALQMGLEAGKTPTCGTVGVGLALGLSFSPIFVRNIIFDKISCFGFSFYVDPWSKIHYYEDVKEYDQSSVHGLDSEKKAMLELEEEGLIKIYR